jgi:hypothetical protein
VQIDYSIQIHHRRLREKFKMETLERHAERLCEAIYARVSAARDARAALSPSSES